MTKKMKKTTRIEATSLPKPDQKLPFLEHFKELKRRLTIVAVSIVAFGTGAYFVQHTIVGFLLKPAAGQHLIYTTPGGGLDFLFRVCIYTVIVCSLPIIIYQILKYFEPLMGGKSLRFALLGSTISALLAIAGMAFGYYAGLPATLHFLFHQFSTNTEIQPLIAVQSYMGFVTLYMFGAALLFQIPLILLFINRIKRIKPRTLIKGERWFVLAAFILAVIMNPTPNVVDQVMLAGPMIVMYQVGIVLIWLANRSHREAPLPKQAAQQLAQPAGTHTTLTAQSNRRRGSRKLSKINLLLEQDAAIRAERMAKLADAKLIWKEASDIADRPISSVIAIADHKPPEIVSTVLTPPEPAPVPVPMQVLEPIRIPVEVDTPLPPQPIVARQRRYVDGFSRNRAPLHHA